MILLKLDISHGTASRRARRLLALTPHLRSPVLACLSQQPMIEWRTTAVPTVGKYHFRLVAPVPSRAVGTWQSQGPAVLMLAYSARVPYQSRYVVMDFEASIDTSAHAVGHAHKRGNFVPALCARPVRACRALLSADTETEHTYVTNP